MTDLPPLPPIPEGDRQTDALKFRRLGTGAGDVLYECWGDAVRAYGAACAAAEREACAKLCDEINDSAWALWRTIADPIEQGRSIGADHCADAIRAMETP